MGNQALAAPLVGEAAQVAALKALVSKSQSTISAIAPKHLNAERLSRIALVEFQRNPTLTKCAPVTVIGGILQAAVLGLEISDGTGRAFLVPFFNSQKNRHEAQLIIGYPGYITLLWNTGLIASTFGAVVHAKDEFSYELGTDPKLRHIPSSAPDPGPVTHAYFGVRFVNGGSQFRVLTVHEIEARRRRSKQGDKGAWKSDYDEMALKTAVRAGRKLIPASTDKSVANQKAIDLDARASAGLAQDLGMVVDENERPTPLVEATAENEPQDTDGPSAAERARATIAGGQAKEPIESQVVDDAPPAEEEIPFEQAAPPARPAPLKKAAQPAAPAQQRPPATKATTPKRF